MTSPLDDALARATDAVERYEAPEPMIEVTRKALLGLSAGRRAEVERAGLIDAVLTVAEIHAGPHRGCGDCAALRSGLAVVMGGLRAQVDGEFAAKLGE